MRDQVRYYLSQNGEPPLGPYSAQQVRKRLNQRKAAATDYIWREGFDSWRPITDVIDELPREEPPPLPEPEVPSSLSINHPDFPDIPTTKLPIPERGIFEPKATLSQKNKLMKLGCTTPELLRNLGRDQASFMIDAFLSDAQAVFQHEHAKRSAEQRKAVGIAVSAVIIASALFGLAKCIKTTSFAQKTPTIEGQVSEPPSASGDATSSHLPATPPSSVGSISQQQAEKSPDLQIGAPVTLSRNVAVQVGSRTVTLSAGRRMTFLGREGDAGRVRYAGADYVVPISAIQPQTAPTATPTAPQPAVRPPMESTSSLSRPAFSKSATAEQICLDYLNNEIQADARYKGQRYSLGGRIESITSKDGIGIVEVHVPISTAYHNFTRSNTRSRENTYRSSTPKLWWMRAYFPDPSALIQYRTGAQIGFTGTIEGVEGRVLTVRDCHVLR